MGDVAVLRARGAEFWDHAAAGWIRHADLHDSIGRPLGAVAIDRLAVAPGEAVLDVGCGCGGTTAELAASVAPGGVAVGVDLSAAMIDAARPRLPDESEPGPFAFADATKVPHILTAAGFQGVGIEPHDVAMTSTAEPDTIAAWLIEIGPAGAAYREATAPRQAAARTAVARLLGRYHTGAGYRLPAARRNLAHHRHQAHTAHDGRPTLTA